MSDTIFTTDRLSVRSLNLDDAGFICELVNDPDWLRNIGDKHVHSIADAERYLANGPMSLYASHGVGLWAVEIRETGQTIGMCGLVKRDALEAFDLGFAYLPNYRGQGYALEAAWGVLRYVREEKQLSELAAIVDRENARSVRLLNKLGFEFFGEFQLAGESKSLDLYYVVLG